MLSKMGKVGTFICMILGHFVGEEVCGSSSH